jgi:dihydroorotase
MSLRNGEIIAIPSPIDVHVHLREPGGETQETIRTGTLAALEGGYQAVFDMPNNPAPHQTWSEEKIDGKIETGRNNAFTNIGFYAGADLKDPAIDELPRMHSKSAGLKLYMGFTNGNNDIYTLDNARPVIDPWISYSEESGSTPPILLHAREEIGYETAQYVASQGHPVHWCHIASASEARLAKYLAKDYPGLFTAGVTPHHLTMTERNADFQQGWNGARMQPPLGQEVDADALLRAFNDGDIAILETDHAPHEEAKKLKAEAENPKGESDNPDCTTCFGVSGIEFILPIMISLVQREKITMERLVDSLHYQPAKMLRLNHLMDNSNTRLAIYPRVLSEKDAVGMSRNHPYLGWVAAAEVIEVTIDGTQRFNRPSNYIANSGNARILRAGSRLSEAA